MTLPPDKVDRVLAGEAIKPGQASKGLDYQSQTRSASALPKDFQTSRTPAQIPGPASLQPALPGQVGGPSLSSLLAQVSTSQDSIVNLRNQLNTKDLQLKRSQQHLLRNKLSDATTYLHAANKRLGAESQAPSTSSGGRPIERFLSYLTDGESQLTAAKQRLAEIGKNKTQMQPSDFLVIQVKLAQAQQEIEYASILLSKVIDSLKTLLNTAL